MTSTEDFKSDSKRDATDSIRGYVYQIYQSALAWMQLKENEILILEGAEDFDVHSELSVTTTQIKDVSNNLTLRSKSIIDSINNYWTCCEDNAGYNIVFRFLTTAEAGQEQGFPFGPDQKGLEYWTKVQSDQSDIGPLREYLLQLNLNPNLLSFIETSTEEEIREKLIGCIKWDMGNKPREALQYILEDKLKVHGLKLHINSHYSCQALPHILKKIADLLSTKGLKVLRLGDFLTCFDEATTITIPRGRREVITSDNNFKQLAVMSDLVEMSRLENVSKSFDSPIPIVDGGISRSVNVSKLSSLLLEQRVIFLYGSSGLGKTNLATLISDEIGGNWQWASFRGMQFEQIKDLLKFTSYALNEAKLTPFLVLDDIDLSQIYQYEREFISAIFSVIDSNGMVIVTGPVRPPLQLLLKLWKNETCEVSVPYFDESEVTDMVLAHGLTESKDASTWARMIWLTTSGHPQLVHARVRNFSTKGWPPFNLSDFTEPEDIERVRTEARVRLINEFPDENARTLAYRLSLLNGAFTRETAIAVAGTTPPINLPGEAFDAIIGPWIEREGEDRYRISPLLTGAARDVLSKAEISAVHTAIAISILLRRKMDQFEVSTAFFHAYMAKDIAVLAKLAYNISTISRENTYPLYNSMIWFTLLGLEEGQRILPDNPEIDLMLRLAQYKLIASSTEPDKAIAVIERVEETLNGIESSELKLHSETSAYALILNTLDVQIPSSMVIRMLSRLIDINEDSSALKDISESMRKDQAILPLLGENTPAQVFFSYLGARLSGLNDLYELITSLESIPEKKRDHLLSVFDTYTDFAPLLVNRAWWKELNNGELDVPRALEVFEYTLSKAREWKISELIKACFVAKSVIQDEYGHSTELALEVLDLADREFPNEACLVNQRAKVLFNAERDIEALPIANKALSLPNLSDIEYVFCCRVAGKAAAKSGDWVESERLFRQGAEKAIQSSTQMSMGVGLKADAAFALWKQKQYESSLLLFADTLELLATIPISENIRIRHLHATVRHSIYWIHCDARGDIPTNYVEPIPGMCSNQEPHEGIKDHRLIDLSAVWEILVSTENILGLNLGIVDRLQGATDGKKPLLMAGYQRALDFETVFKKKKLDHLVPKVIEMIEGLYLSKKIEEEQVDGWEVGDIPKLPDDYWDNFEDWDWFKHYMLVASVICAAEKDSDILPTDIWRTDLSSAGILNEELEHFLNVLEGAKPDGSLYQQAAAKIFLLINETLSPVDLWTSSFRLLNALMNEKKFVEAALEKLLTTLWLFSAKKQRFTFSTPALICPMIEKCCLNAEISGFVKIASILKMSAPYLNIQLPIDSVKMIEGLME